MPGNPFHFTTPIPPARFLGRRAAVEQIASDLCSWSGDSYAVVGGRRLGKSSLMLALNDHLIGKLDPEMPELHVVPVYISLKSTTINSPQDVWGLILHRVRKTLHGAKRRPPLSSPLLTLALPEYTQVVPTPASVQELEAAVEEMVSAADPGFGAVRVALLIDEVDSLLGYSWTGALCGNLRSIFYDGDMKDFIRLVVAGSGRFRDVEETGSPLFNAVKVYIMEAFHEDAVCELVSRAEGVNPGVANEVVQQGGGHPFILQYILYYLFESGIEAATLDSVSAIVRRFCHNRSGDLDGWWNDIGEDGRNAYSILRQSDEWMTASEIRDVANHLNLQANRGLAALCDHGVVIHDGTYQKYRISGHLFRDWFEAQYQSITGRSPMVYTGRQYKQLTDALVDAFNEAGLERVVRYGLDRRLSAIAGGNDLTAIAFRLVEWARAQGLVEQLVVAARNENPGNLALRTFAEHIGLAPVSTLSGEAEQIVLKSVKFTNVEQWRQRMSVCELPVCRVEIPEGFGVGTGFLLGPGIVMTNYHVVEKLIQTPELRTKAVLRFDYKTTADGKTLWMGQVYRIVENSDWLIDSSPEPELDYALLRVGGDPGNQPLGGQQGAQPRKWLAPKQHTFEVGEPLFIIQHPEAEPLKLAPGSVIDVETNQGRITYTANTEHGSSGSPCFSSEWDLVALHHYGYPTKNEGITFTAILERLKQKNLLKSLGEP